MGNQLGSQPDKPQHLSDKLALREEIGRGGFGTVYAATCRGSGREYAVKRISKRSSALASVNQEADLHKRLAHPSVVELHDVYSSAHTVDLVFSIYRGGDLMSGMILHWDKKGDIPMPAVQNVTWQMFRAIEWLHRNNVVHRDVKPDNFLLDREDLAHPECRVLLSDFGTAVELRPDGRRLTERCGTELYWSPEFWAKVYGRQVDVWAVGVTMYGMVTGTFPFESKAEVEGKTVEVPSRCGGDGESFVLGTLTRNEKERLTASDALEHAFLAPLECAARVAEASHEAPVKAASSSGGDQGQQADGRTAENKTVEKERTLRAYSLGVIACLLVMVGLLFMAASRSDSFSSFGLASYLRSFVEAPSVQKVSGTSQGTCGSATTS